MDSYYCSIITTNLVSITIANPLEVSCGALVKSIVIELFTHLYTSFHSVGILQLIIN